MDLFEAYDRSRGAMEADKHWKSQLAWAQSNRRPESPEQMAVELIWVISNSGMRYKVAKKIHARVMGALLRGNDVIDVFAHKGKAGAMQMIWDDRSGLFARMPIPEQLVDWCGALPWIGPITKYHAAKNLGADVAKPDRWLERLASIFGETPQQLCDRVAVGVGETIAAVDLIFWYGLSSGVLTLSEIKHGGEDDG